MGWRTTAETADRVEWERSDGYAIIVARETATGRWAITLDRFEQAPEGPTYVHETVDARDEALSLAERWRLDHDTE